MKQKCDDSKSEQAQNISMEDTISLFCHIQYIHAVLDLEAYTGGGNWGLTPPSPL